MHISKIEIKFLFVEKSSMVAFSAKQALYLYVVVYIKHILSTVKQSTTCCFQFDLDMPWVTCSCNRSWWVTTRESERKTLARCSSKHISPEELLLPDTGVSLKQC